MVDVPPSSGGQESWTLPGAGVTSAPASSAPAPNAPGSPEPGHQRSPSKRWILPVSAALALALAVAALVLALSSRSDTHETSTQPSKFQPAREASADQTADLNTPGRGATTTKAVEPTAPETTSPPSPTLAPQTVPLAAPTPVPTIAATPGRVARTCGASGDGDCFLTLREHPTSDSASLGELWEGSEIFVECAVRGGTTRSSIIGRSNVWLRDVNGRYVAHVFVDVPGWDPFNPTVPC